VATLDQVADFRVRGTARVESNIYHQRITGLIRTVGHPIPWRDVGPIIGDLINHYRFMARASRASELRISLENNVGNGSLAAIEQAATAVGGTVHQVPALKRIYIDIPLGKRASGGG
jgi:hypothetical protein